MRKAHLVSLTLATLCAVFLAYLIIRYPNPIGLVFLWLEGIVFGFVAGMAVYDKS